MSDVLRPVKRAVLVLVVMLSMCSVLAGYALYVNYAADPELSNGSIEYPYTEIQDAIDHAFNDTLPENLLGPSVIINVYDYASGYYENLSIDFVNVNGQHYVTDITIQSISNDPVNCLIVALNSTLPVIAVTGNTNSKLKLKGLNIKQFVQMPEIYHRGITLDILSGTGYSGHFNTLNIDHCRFDNNDVDVDINYNYVTISNLRVTDSEFRIPRGCNLPNGINTQSAGVGSNVYIQGNEFMRINPNNVESEAIRMGHNVVDIVIEDNLFENVYVYSPNNYNQQNITIRNNDFYESYLNIDNRGSWRIEKNRFVGLSNPDDKSAIGLFGGVQYLDTECIIERNQFFGCFLPLEVGLTNDLLNRVKVKLNGNSFINCGGIITLQRHSNMNWPSNAVTEYKNNLYYGMSNAPFIIIDQNNTPLVLTGENRIPVSFSHFSALLTSTASLILDTPSISYGNPDIVIDEVNNTYSLIWDQYIRSRLINKGASLQNYRTDPDGTPPDIGAVYYPHYNRIYDFSIEPIPGSSIRWMSFPVVDDRSYTDVQHWNELGHLFEQHMSMPPDNQIISADWSYNPSSGSMTYNYNEEQWQYDYYVATQPKGFKLKFNENTGEIDPITVNGFKANPATTPIELTREITIGSNTYDFDNWIGYFVPYTQGAGTAFSRLLPGSTRETYLDHIYGIETQTWSTKRIDKQYGSGWIIDPNRYTLSEGDMVAIKLLPNAPEDMFWMSLSQAEPPRTKEAAINFSYKEELDYTPIFIELDPED